MSSNKTINFKNHEIEYHPTWAEFFTCCIIEEIEAIELLIGNNFTPPVRNIFRFFSLDLKNIKFIILGQDPYPQKGVATGRAFEMAGLINWTGEMNRSLINIIKLLYKNKKGCTGIEKLKFSTIEFEVKMRTFNIKPPSELFDNWENQGVLLLNTALTCEIGTSEKSNSHQKIWSMFSRALIEFIVKKNNKCTWLLWGRDAQKLLHGYNKVKKLECSHPRLNGSGEGSFFKENHFAFTEKKYKINWY